MGPTLPQQLDAIFAGRGDAPALETPQRRWTYRELVHDVEAACGHLLGSGLVPGRPVALLLEDRAALLVAHLAALACGAISTPVNPRATPDELAHVLADAEPPLLVADEACAALAERACARLARPPAPWPARADGPPPRARPPLPSDPEAPATLLYTSGTTGRPKGVPWTHGQLVAHADALHALWQWRADDVLLHVLPLFHVHGLFVAAHGAWRAGARVVLAPRFDAPACLERLERGDITVFMGVPTMYHRLVEAARAREARLDVSSVRLFLCGSAPLRADTLQGFTDLFRRPLLERYGMTECGIVAAHDPRGRTKPGSVGRAVPGAALRIVDPQTLSARPAGEIGEVQVRGPTVFAGYWHAPEATAAVFTPDGWLRTGDLGLLDDGGYLFLAGRRKELVITGGFNVYPREVEAVLEMHPQVAECAVVGRADEDLGEVVVALVVGHDGARPDPDALDAHCRLHLAAYKCPRAIRLVDALPRNATGKLDRAALARDVRAT